jgi:hypothetical protein
MLKKVVFALLALIVVYSCAVVAFRIYEPRNDTNVVEESAYLDYDSLKEYVLSTGESVTHYFFFYSRNDNDCVYVKNTVLASVSTNTQLQIDRIIETVDITSLEDNMTTGKLANDWGISNYPAFAAVTVSEGNPSVLNSLEYDGEIPLSAAQVEEWLALNGLTAVKQETPAGN